MRAWHPTLPARARGSKPEVGEGLLSQHGGLRGSTGSSAMCREGGSHGPVEARAHTEAERRAPLSPSRLLFPLRGEASTTAPREWPGQSTAFTRSCLCLPSKRPFHQDRHCLDLGDVRHQSGPNTNPSVRCPDISCAMMLEDFLSTSQHPGDYRISPPRLKAAESHTSFPPYSGMCERINLLLTSKEKFYNFAFLA